MFSKIITPLFTTFSSTMGLGKMINSQVIIGVNQRILIVSNNESEYAILTVPLLLTLTTSYGPCL